jgi:hypothetical protein
MSKKLISSKYASSKYFEFMEKNDVRERIEGV